MQVVVSPRSLCIPGSNKVSKQAMGGTEVDMQAQMVRHGPDGRAQVQNKQAQEPGEGGGHGTERRKDLERTGTGWFAQGQERAREPEQERKTRGTALVSRPCSQHRESEVQWVQPTKEMLTEHSMDVPHPRHKTLAEHQSVCKHSRSP